jgi:predicted alpha/beta hydrolase family esterase
MKQQVIIIHGGNIFESYAEYISSLKNCLIRPEYLRPQPDWKNSLAAVLGPDFDVLMPRMPNALNAKFEEWKIWFARILALSDEGVILIGHSLGALFLVKYFSENQSPKKVGAVILVGAPFDDESSDEKLASFALAGPLDKFSAQVGLIYLLQSKDDPVVDYAQVEKYRKALPEAKIMLFADRGHFNAPAFPEIVDLIREIAVKL